MMMATTTTAATVAGVTTTVAMTTSASARVYRAVVFSLSSALGLGYAPKGPGTFGTLAAIPLWFLLARLPLWTWGVLVLVAIAVAVAVASEAERLYGAHDVQRIVIDEVVGLLATSFAVPFAWPEVLVAFVLFRALDVWKPGVIGLIDRRVHGGFGVVMDDVAAGVLGCGLLHVARGLLGGWW